MTESLLKIKNLSVDFKTSKGIFHAVKDVSFDIEAGETLALVGESGSGKSVTALSCLKLLPYPIASHPQNSSILFEGQDILKFPEKDMMRMRGSKISMIFQEPQSSLNPLHTIEKQIGEVLKIHQGMNKEHSRARIIELLDLVGLERLKDRINAYPHELSGGQRQRVMIAMALANNPKLLIADEPTTALDVTIQAQILDLLQKLQKDLNMALLLITHDLSIVEKMADQICVMKNGELVEHKKSKDLFAKPEHIYTQTLLAARPKGEAPPAQANAPVLLDVKDLKVHFTAKKSFFGKPIAWVKAVDDVNFTLKKGHTLGVVGESGSGKTTLGLAILKLTRSTGNIFFDQQDISPLNRSDMRPLRARMQIVFQDPYGSLSPRMSVAQIIGEGLKLHQPKLTNQDIDDKIICVLQDVQMNPDTRHRYPHEFSGGQRQRISIARAMILNPEFVVLDEPTSALDVSVQVEIVDLLRDLQEKHNLTYMFISHDLRVVRALSHDILVMKDGKIVESGDAKTVFNAPKEDYTKTLLDAAMNLKASAH